jgi:hypothetical protein
MELTVLFEFGTKKNRLLPKSTFFACFPLPVPVTGFEPLFSVICVNFSTDVLLWHKPNIKMYLIFLLFFQKKILSFAFRY